MPLHTYNQCCNPHPCIRWGCLGRLLVINELISAQVLLGQCCSVSHSPWTSDRPVHFPHSSRMQLRGPLIPSRPVHLLAYNRPAVHWTTAVVTTRAAFDRQGAMDSTTAAAAAGSSRPSSNTEPQTGWTLAVHGGAGVINSTNKAWLQDAERGLEASLRAGEAVLACGGSAIDAVVAAVMAMEDDPHFNAGEGVV